ncbi:MAG: hypothetical protein D3903_09140 [Candidatus Electrothrix sp. GM3_4]|nr:hypothetical protein [Candidatus Electrothrix sp. GM3_4]
MEIASISAALLSIKSATDIAKMIKDSSSSLEAAEIKYKLAELIGSLGDTKLEMANIKELVLEKDIEIKKLEKKISLKANVKWEDPYYFVISETDDKDGPYCQKCYDSNNKLIRLQSPNKNGYWTCNECESNYQDGSYKSPYADIAVVTSGSSRRKFDGF